MHRFQEVLRVNQSELCTSSSQEAGPACWLFYVRNQKAASSFVIDAMRRQFKRRAAMILKPYALDGARPTSAHEGIFHEGSGSFTFSIVRNPVSAARSGYMEVSRRRTGASMADGTSSAGESATYRRLSCARADERYAAFLQTVIDGAPMGPELFHAFPQALKLSAATHYDVLLQHESLNASVGGQLHALRRAGLDLLSRGFELRPPDTHKLNASGLLGCEGINFRAPMIAPLFCKLYAADYACGFGYERLRECSRSS